MKLVVFLLLVSVLRKSSVVHSCSIKTFECRHLCSEVEQNYGAPFSTEVILIKFELTRIRERFLKRRYLYSSGNEASYNPTVSGPPRARIGPGDRWDRGPLNVSDDWKQWRFETIFYTH